MKPVHIVAILVVASATLVVAKKLPRYSFDCQLTDPELDACVLKFIESLRPRLAKGISRLHIPPIDPFLLPSLELHRDLDGRPMHLRIKDFRAFGASHFRIESVRVDMKNRTASAKFLAPVVSIDGEYDYDGLLLGVPIRGSGLFRGNYTSVGLTVTLHLKTEPTEGVERLALASVNAKANLPGVADVQLLSHTKNPHNSGIVDAASKFFNQNQKQVYSVIYPILDQIATEVVTNFSGPIIKALKIELMPTQGT